MCFGLLEAYALGALEQSSEIVEVKGIEGVCSGLILALFVWVFGQ